MSATMSSTRPIRMSRTRPAYVEMLDAIKVKLAAFTEPPSTTLAKYPEQDRSVLARYARAIAYYRIPDLDKALPTIDGLIRDYPRDPYFRELKGQMLFENGHIKEAVQPYEEAVRLDPNAPLLRIESGAGLYREQRSRRKTSARSPISATRCGPRTRKSTPGICSRPPMAATTRSAWRRCLWPRRGSPPTTKRTQCSRPAAPSTCCRKTAPPTRAPRRSAREAKELDDSD